jgi:VWFA-related protein
VLAVRWQRQQEVPHLTFEDAPLAIGLVFDTSGRVGRKMTKSRAAVAEFLRAANPEDEFFLVEFDDSAKLTQARTSEAGDILARLNRVSPRGRTALLDAIALGLEELRKSDKPRKALVLLSDGGDNRSGYTENAIRGMVQESDARICAMGIFEASGAHLSAEEIAGPSLLNEISEASGGRMYTVGNINDLPGIAGRIGVELHNQYVLAYSPAKLQNDGKRHRVRVKVAPPIGLPAVRADWRAGYHAPVN